MLKRIYQSFSISLLMALTCAAAPTKAETESQLRVAVNERQLSSGFGNSDVAPALDALAKALAESGQSEEAKEATELARAIRAGELPADFNATVEMKPSKCLLVRKRLHSPLGRVGDAFFVLYEKDEGYTELLNSLGEIAPGKAKLLAPLAGELDWAEACGYTDPGTKEVALVEQFLFKYQAGKGVKTLQLTNKETAWTTAHILAHTLDNLKGRSHSEDFRRAYLEDSAAIPTGERARLAYFLQKGDAGCEETYAEAYAALSCSEHEKELDELFLKRFPNCIKLIESQRKAAD